MVKEYYGRILPVAKRRTIRVGSSNAEVLSVKLAEREGYELRVVDREWMTHFTEE